MARKVVAFERDALGIVARIDPGALLQDAPLSSSRASARFLRSTAIPRASTSADAKRDSSLSDWS
jgi:hypothetical protein